MSFSDLLAEINSTLGTSASIPSRQEPSPKARSSRRSTGVPRPDLVRRSISSPPQSRKPSVSSMPLGQQSPSRWKGLQKQLPRWLEETKGVDTIPSIPAVASTSTSASYLAQRLASASINVKESRSGSVTSQTSAIGSTRNTGTAAGNALKQRFVDVVQQVTNPSWLSAIDTARADSKPNMTSSQSRLPRQSVLSTAEGAAQDLLARISATLSSQTAEGPEVPAPETPNARESRIIQENTAGFSQRAQSRLAAKSSDLGSAEVSEIEGLLSRQPTAKQTPKAGQTSNIQAELSVRGTTNASMLDAANQLGSSPTQVDEHTQYSRMQQNPATTIKHSNHAPLHQQQARHGSADWLYEQKHALGPVEDREKQPLFLRDFPGDSARTALSAAPAHQGGHIQNRSVAHMLQRSYIDLPSLENLRVKWMQRGIQPELFSPPGLQ